MKEITSTTENHVVVMDNIEIHKWQFSKELIALIQKFQSVSKTRPVIITLQIGNTRWIYNSNFCNGVI